MTNQIHTAEEIELARWYFEMNHRATWFQIEGKRSINREEIFGYEPTYSID